MTNPNPSPELKPCPFCGGEAFIRHIEAHDHTPMLKALLPQIEPAEDTYWPECGCGAAKEGYNSRSEAIAAWNTHALSPQTLPAPGEVERPTDTDVAEALRHGFGDRIANQVLADDSADRFAGWSTIDLAAQCRMQAREGLDPDYEKFMHALSDRLLAFASRDDTSC